MPVLVDAAAEILSVPNVHLQLGADLVGYSGGKCLRGPQAAGLLLGRKDLVKAAWVGSAPHHGFGRGFKVGKEEAIGMLMAVEMWCKRDHDAEWKQWQAWLDSHRAPRVGDRRRDDLGHAAGGALEPDAVAPDPLGPPAPRPHGRSRGQAALRDGAPGLALPGARASWRRTRPASRSVPT